MPALDYAIARALLHSTFAQAEKELSELKSTIALAEIMASCDALFNSRTQAYARLSWAVYWLEFRTARSISLALREPEAIMLNSTLIAVWAILARAGRCSISPLWRGEASAIPRCAIAQPSSRCYCVSRKGQLTGRVWLFPMGWVRSVVEIRGTTGFHFFADENGHANRLS